MNTQQIKIEYADETFEKSLLETLKKEIETAVQKQLNLHVIFEADEHFVLFKFSVIVPTEIEDWEDIEDDIEEIIKSILNNHDLEL